MKIYLGQIKANYEFNEKKNSGFADSEFVKTCDELVIGLAACCTVVMLSPRMSMLPSVSSRPRGPSSLLIGALLVSR